MKKTFVLAALSAVFASSAYAADVPAQVAGDAPSELHLSVFDNTSGTPVDLGVKTVSRSSKTQQLCWVAQGVFPDQVTSVETIAAPAKTRFVTQNGMVLSVSEDGKNHVVATPRASKGGNRLVEGCWAFEESDPVGDYQIQVSIGGIDYQPLNFSVGK